MGSDHKLIFFLLYVNRGPVETLSFLSYLFHTPINFRSDNFICALIVLLKLVHVTRDSNFNFSFLFSCVLSFISYSVSVFYTVIKKIYWISLLVIFYYGIIDFISFPIDVLFSATFFSNIPKEYLDQVKRDLKRNIKILLSEGVKPSNLLSKSHILLYGADLIQSAIDEFLQEKAALTKEQKLEARRARAAEKKAALQQFFNSSL